MRSSLAVLLLRASRRMMLLSDDVAPGTLNSIRKQAGLKEKK
jgi:hypothetical protein